ncbi:MAG: NAD-dependent epimerase/dehydratase family protein [Candidatus Roizmanbacteria bacterium]|nr:MAG: NAD-dependent epimerase/dehydratase family protein [Candidatus Roizmanbacteria bacterium]
MNKRIKKELPLSSVVIEDCLNIIKSINLKPFKGKKILLTGSNGFFGRYIAHIIYSLNKKKGYNTTLYCLSLHSPNQDIKTLSSLDKNIIPIKKDLSKDFNFKHTINYIIHAACYAQPQKFIERSLETIELNVNTTKRLLELARKNNTSFLFFSSAETYGEIPEDKIPVSESYNGNCSVFGPRAVYSESKRLGEVLCSVFRRDYNLMTFIARISHIYGPGISINDKRVLGDFIRKAVRESSITLLDKGTAVKTFGYIADAVKMLLNILIWGKDIVYNVGGKDTVSIRKLAEEVASHYHVAVRLPKDKAKLLHIGTDPQVVKLDISKYTKEFGESNSVSLNSGIKKMLDWNSEQLNQKPS